MKITSAPMPPLTPQEAFTDSLGWTREALRVWRRASGDDPRVRECADRAIAAVEETIAHAQEALKRKKS